MTPELIGTIAVGIAILGFLWSLHRDIAGIHRDIGGLRERMSRIEGLIEGLKRRQQEGGSPAARA